MSVKELATKFAGENVKCITQATALGSSENFEGSVVGYRVSGKNEYVAIGVGANTEYRIEIFEGFKNGWHWVIDYAANKDRPVKRVNVNEITWPGDGKLIKAPAAKEIPPWPDFCPDCKSPAYIGGLMIDCSNAKCHQKFSTRSGIDLFLPVEMREIGWDKAKDVKTGLDANGFIVCPECNKRAHKLISLSTKLDFASVRCLGGHKWNKQLSIGDKLEISRAGAKVIIVWSGQAFK